jgi:hypothetical protein
MRIAIEITDNPVNPWFKPAFTTDIHLFHPAKDRDDRAPRAATPIRPAFTPYSMQFPLAVEKVDAVSIAKFAAGRLNPNQLGESMFESQRIQKVMRSAELRSRSGAPPPMKRSRLPDFDLEEERLARRRLNLLPR